MALLIHCVLEILFIYLKQNQSINWTQSENKKSDVFWYHKYDISSLRLTLLRGNPLNIGNEKTFLQNLKEMSPLCYIDSDMINKIEFLTTHRYVTRCEGANGYT